MKTVQVNFVASHVIARCDAPECGHEEHFIPPRHHTTEELAKKIETTWRCLRCEVTRLRLRLSELDHRLRDLEGNPA